MSENPKFSLQNVSSNFPIEPKRHFTEEGSLLKPIQIILNVIKHSTKPDFVNCMFNLLKDNTKNYSKMWLSG